MRSHELAGKIGGGDAPVVIDVRTGIEFRSGHIPGALHVPTWKILSGQGALPSDKGTELVILCELGPRAVIARLLIRLLGYRNTSLLDGHMAGWRRNGLPLEL